MKGLTDVGLFFLSRITRIDTGLRRFYTLCLIKIRLAHVHTIYSTNSLLSLNGHHFKPIAFVKNSRKEVTDDYWGSIISEIELTDDIPTDAFNNIESFSHLEIIFYFDKVEKTVYSGRPRGNPDYPLVGIFAQRKKDRPNQIGLTTVELIEHNNRIIKVKGLDAIDGTPILDIKPVFREFAPKAEIKQPEWVEELMKDYWK